MWMFNVNMYQFQLCSTLAWLQDFVEMHITEAARHQKTQYDRVQEHQFRVGDSVWLSIPIYTAGKQEPRWQGGGRSNSSEDPTPTRLVMAQHCGLYISTNYSNEFNPHSEHYPTLPTSVGVALRSGHHLQYLRIAIIHKEHYPKTCEGECIPV